MQQEHSNPMLEAIIFDFDGVVVDSEPIHMACFLRVMRPYGVEFTIEQYYNRYLAYSDRDAMTRMIGEYDLDGDSLDINALIAQKSAMVQEALARTASPLPGSIELMQAARDAGLGLAICSAALGEEVRQPLRRAGALDLVQLIIAAEDVEVHKPDPAGYILARRKLGEILGRELAPERCVAIEDSPGGVAAGKAAGLCVLAVTNTVGADRLAAADRIVDSLADVTPASLDEMVS